MVSLIESARSAWHGIISHRFRSFLTMLGIIIGVASVIAVVSIVQGMAYSISKNFDDLGSNSLTIRSDTSFEEQLQGKTNRLTLVDYRRLAAEFDDVSDITPTFAPFGIFGTTIRAGRQTAFTRVSAVTANYQDTNKIYPVRGRFLTPADDRSRRKVAVIGEKLRQNLELPFNPIGTFIELGGEWFKVVGVMEERGDLFGLSQDDYLLLPFSTGESLAGQATEQDISISLNVRDVATIEAVQDRAEQVLRQARGIKPGEQNDFKVQTAKQLAESFSQVTDTVTMVLGGIVAISLLVGGIGIMNIMLVSVTERTREIGIRKALGAQRYEILLQFLVEATILSLIGGVIGLVIGSFVGFGASHIIPNFPGAIVPTWAILLALGFSAMIGIIFGVVPAAKAANLNPIEALRYE